jgi:hypothetical protein
MKASFLKAVLSFAVLTLLAAPLTARAGLSSGKWRYKMTVEVETPEGVKTGSAVREVSVQQKPNLVREMAGVDVKVKGEAVVVDLGKRGILFAVMRNDIGPDYNYQVVFNAFPIPGEQYGAGGFTASGLMYYSQLKDAKAVLPPELYPTMVNFADIHDPKSVEPVWEGEYYKERVGLGSKRAFRVKQDNFEKIFGTGVKLKEVTVEMTKEPVNKGIIRILTWLPQYYDKMLDGDRGENTMSENRFANKLSSGAFSTEDSPHR